MNKATNQNLVDKLVDVGRLIKGMDAMKGEADDKLLIAYGGTIYTVSVEAVGYSCINDMRDFEDEIKKEKEPVLC